MTNSSNLEIILKYVAGLVPTAGSFLVGAYKGSMDAQNIPTVDIDYLILTSSPLGALGWVYNLHCTKKPKVEGISNLVKVGLSGALAAPSIMAVGYGIGYIVGKGMDEMFF